MATRTRSGLTILTGRDLVGRVLPPFKRVYDSRDGAERAAAFEQAAEFRADSIRAVKAPPMLKGKTADQLFELWRQGQLYIERRVSPPMLFPAVSGAAETLDFMCGANGITTGTALKTLLELSGGANVQDDVFQWWCEFNGSAAAAAILVELLRATGAITSTSTSYGPNNIIDGGSTSQSTAVSGTAGSTNGSDGTRGAILETHYVPPTSGVIIQYPLGREVVVAKSGRLRIAATAGAAVNSATGLAFME